MVLKSISLVKQTVEKYLIWQSINLCAVVKIFINFADELKEINFLQHVNIFNTTKMVIKDSKEIQSILVEGHFLNETRS